MKLYDTVITIMREAPETRNSDKRLMWQVWETLGYVKDGKLTVEAFLDKDCPTPESITRCRRKIQESDLQASESVKRLRQKRAQEKGTHIYREETSKKGHFEYIGSSAIWVED